MYDPNYRDPSKQEDVDDPQWGHASKVHEWRNHVGYLIREAWATFTPAQRLLLAEDADDRAKNEIWE